MTFYVFISLFSVCWVVLFVMTSTSSSMNRGSAASSHAMADTHHESKFSHFKTDISSELKKLKNAFSHHSETRVAPLPPDSTPTSKQPGKENFLMRNFHEVEGRLKDIKTEFTSHKKGDAITDVLLLPTHMMMDEVYKPAGREAAHIVAQIGPTILRETAGPLVMGGVVVIAVAMLIFLSYREVNHVVDKALG